MARNIRSMKFSASSLIGALFGFSLILGAILIGTTNYLAFISVEGIMIVFGGALAVAFMSFEANYVVEALRALGLMFKKPAITHENLHHEMVYVINWARVVKEKGLRGLEDETDGQKAVDHFVRYGIDMVISNYDMEDVRTMMETAADAIYERDTIPAKVLQAMASHAPAFGMVGTLVGMVIMLGNFSADMSQIGKGLSVSLLATLYGVVSARMLYMPAAEKIMQKQNSLRFRNQLVTEGMVMLVGNRTTQHIQDHLNSFLRLDRKYKVEGRPANAIRPPNGPRPNPMIRKP